MIDYPKTIEEARSHRYHTWAGNPKGDKYIEGHCAYEVWERGRGIRSYQCYFKNGHGPGGLYCRIHTKKIANPVG